jgi:CBS domain containing-hemolysin-like protein
LLARLVCSNQSNSLKKVSDIMSKDVRYIHEEESLDQALRAFLKTHHHLFVVVNNFEEFVGVLSIEDVLEEIIGKEIVDEFDAYDDLRAVAASIADKERAKRQKTVKTEKK